MNIFYVCRVLVKASLPTSRAYHIYYTQSWDLYHTYTFWGYLAQKESGSGKTILCFQLPKKIKFVQRKHNKPSNQLKNQLIQLSQPIGNQDLVYISSLWQPMGRGVLHVSLLCYSQQKASVCIFFCAVTNEKRCSVP